MEEKKIGEIKIKRPTFLQILFVVCVAANMFTQQIYLPYNNMGKYYVGVLFLIVFCVVNSFKVSFTKEDRLFGNALILPWIFVCIISVIGDIFNKNPLNYLSRSVSNVLWVLLAISFAWVSYKLFNKKSIDFIFIACIINYTLVILKFVQVNGFAGLLASFNYKDIVNSERLLEVHELTYVFGLFILYFIFSKNVHRRKLKLFFSILYFFMGFKRIAIAALLISIALILILKRVKKNSTYKSFILVCSCFCVLCSLVFVYLIKTDGIISIFNHFNIETNGRIFLWSIFNDKISFFPLPFGYGIGYTDRQLEVLHYPQLHNDILRLFLGVGLISFIIFFWKLFYSNSKKMLVQINADCSKIYLAMFMFIFINMFFSNAGFGYWIYFCFSGIVLNMIKETENQH